MLAAGAARIDITPDFPCFLHGYAARDHEHEGVHDRLGLRALYAKGKAPAGRAKGRGKAKSKAGKKGNEAVLVSADILWFGDNAAGAIKAQLKKKLGLEPAQVFLTGTHTHSAPAGTGKYAKKVNEKWIELLVERAVAACLRAKAAARPVHLKMARGSCRIGINRRELRADGKVILGRNPGGPVDRELIALVLEDEKGHKVASLANFACHGVVLGQENYQISGDWPGFALKALETKLGAPAFLFNGGAGDVNPRIGPQNNFEPVKKLANEFVGDYLGLKEHFWDLSDEEDEVAGRESVVKMPRKPGQEKRVVKIRGIRLGPIRIVGYPGEMFSDTSLAVRRGMGDSPVMVCAYVDGGEEGYVPVREAYALGGYEVDSSPYTPDGEGVLRKGLLDLAGKL